MRRNRNRTTHRAYVSGAVILTLGILALLLTALASYTEKQRVSERMTELAARADLILISARDWSAAHADELLQVGEKVMPLDDLLPETYTGTMMLHLEGATSEHPRVLCDLTLHHGSYSVSRETAWPLDISSVDNTGS